MRNVVWGAGLALTLFACGDGVDLVEAHGSSASSSSSASGVVASSVSVTTGSGGADSSSSGGLGGGEAGAGGVGTGGRAGMGGSGGEGGVPVGDPRTVNVATLDNAPAAGAYVVGHDPAGAVVDYAVTSASGQAVVYAPDGGMLTVASETLDTLPDGMGNFPSYAFRQIRTITEIDGKSTWNFTLALPPMRSFNPPMQLELTTNIPGANAVYAFSSCARQSGLATPVGVTTLFIRGCPGANTVDLTVFTFSGSGGTLGEKVYSNVPLVPGSTLAVSVQTADLVAPTGVATYNPGAGPSQAVFGLHGMDATGTSICTSNALGYGPNNEVTVALPPCSGVTSWVVQEGLLNTPASGMRQRRISSYPTVSTWVPTPLTAPTSEQWLPTSTSLRPHVSWAWPPNGPSPSADGIRASLFGNTIVWSMWLPQGATEARAPALPLPIATWPSISSVELIAADAQTAAHGRAELFESAYPDMEMSTFVYIQ